MSEFVALLALATSTVTTFALIAALRVTGGVIELAQGLLRAEQERDGDGR